MTTPYELLGVAEDAGDSEIKQAYLQRVKEFPPERAPETFRRINQAYLSIKDHKSRLQQALLAPPQADFELLLDQALNRPEPVRIGPQQLKKLLTAALEETNLLQAVADDNQR